jgi:hypothetical protein
MNTGSYKHAFSGFHAPELSIEKALSRTELDNLFAYYLQASQEYRYDISEESLQAYKHLEKTPLQSGLLQKAIKHSIDSHLHSTYSQKDQDRVRQTAMRIIFEALKESCLVGAEKLLIDERFPSPIASLLTACIVPLISYKEKPTSKNLLIQPSYVHELIEMLTELDRTLLRFYSYKPELYMRLGKPQSRSAVYKLWENRAALHYASSMTFQSTLLYGKHSPEWFLGLYKALCGKHSLVQGCQFILQAITAGTLSLPAFTSFTEKCKLNWDSKQIINQKTNLPFLYDAKNASPLPFTAQVLGLGNASDLISRHVYQCTSCYTLYTPIPDSGSKALACSTCKSFYSLFSSASKRFTNLSPIEEKLLHTVRKRLRESIKAPHLEKKSIYDIISAPLLLEKLHNQHWLQYKKLSLRAHDKNMREILSESLLDNLFLYKMQTILPNHSPHKSMDFFSFSPWSSCFFPKKTTKAMDWIQGFLSYLVFPFPLSSLFSYKTFGGADAHIESLYKGCYLTENSETYKQVTSKWPKELFQMAGGHSVNPYYLEEEKPGKVNLRTLAQD